MAARFRVTAVIELELERGPEPTKEQVSQAVADRLGGGVYHLSVDTDDGFEGSRVVPRETIADLAELVGGTGC